MLTAGSDENLTGKPKIPSEKHDVLFCKARYVLNQRHIKRPWFNLNPFLEKTDENIDLENFLPGESKYIQPLKSLVLCESFHSKNPVDTREISIDSFFPYLFSAEWDNGCSLRILEGQLLDEILLGLYRLENEGAAVRHTTHALARNHHYRTGSYELTGSSGVAETLLIEFAHFGRLIKEKPNRKTQDAFEYLKLDRRNEEISTQDQAIPKLSDETEISDKRQRTDIIHDNGKHTKYLSSSTTPDKNKPDGHKSIMTKHVNAIGFLKALKPDNKCQPYTVLPPIQQNKRHSVLTADVKPFLRPNLIPSTLPLSESRRHTVTDRSYLSTNRPNALAVPQPVMERAQLTFKYMNQKGKGKTSVNCLDNRDSFKCNTSNSKARPGAKRYSLDFEDDFISEQSSAVEVGNQIQEKKDVFFGEEFYLSDHKGNCKHYLQSAKKILEQKEKELNERRKETKCKKGTNSRNICKLPELPKIDMENLDAYRMYNETLKMPDEVPTFEEFASLLKRDEIYDPRYRNKVRIKSKKMAERYYMTKAMRSSHTVYNNINNTSDIRNAGANRLSSYQRKSIRSTLGKVKQSNEEENKRHRIRLPALYHSYTPICNIIKLPEFRTSNPSTSIHEHGLEVLGVTGSEPCKNHFIKCKEQMKTCNKDESSSSLKSPIFPKITLVSDDDIESLDSESKESLNVEKLDESFDTNKLNLRYSIERIRKKRRGKVKKKAGIIGVLAKYYNIHKKISAFKKSCNSKENKKEMKRATPFGKKMQRVKQDKEEEEMVIGKMKQFKFLNVRNKKKLNLENIPRGEFTSSNLTKFHQHLREALNMFVVRREIVVSDQNTFYNATTTVTFTKQSCFHLEAKQTCS